MLFLAISKEIEKEKKKDQWVNETDCGQLLGCILIALQPQDMLQEPACFSSGPSWASGGLARKHNETLEGETGSGLKGK